MQTPALYRYISILSIIGIFLAIYLLWQQIFRPEFQPCTINATVNCDAVISGEVASTFGIPTPLIGLAGYVIILFSSLFKQKKLILGMAAFGLAFCLWIAYKELFQLRVICPVCIACQLIMTTIFGLSVALNKKRDVKKG